MIITNPTDAKAAAQSGFRQYHRTYRYTPGGRVYVSVSYLAHDGSGCTWTTCSQAGMLQTALHQQSMCVFFKRTRLQKGDPPCCAGS